MINLTKYTRWIPPTKSTIFETPVIVTESDGHTERLLAVVLERKSGHLVLESGGAFSVDSELYIPIPKTVAIRLTRDELLDLMAMGGWVLKDDVGDMYSYYIDNERTIGIQIEDRITGIRRAFTTEWLEPTTDLLPKESK